MTRLRSRFAILALLSVTSFMALSASNLPQAEAAYGAPRVCRDIFQPDPKVARTSLFPDPAVDLMDFHMRETKHLSASMVRGRNDAALKRLQKYIPGADSSKSTGPAISYAQFQQVLNVMADHSVVGMDARPNYNRDGTEIGYCFGRAAYVHLLLLRMGLQEESILKAWTVGPQVASEEGINWAFHVATAAYVQGYGWMVADLRNFKIVSIDHWSQSLLSTSTDGKARLYFTEAKRFSVKAPNYSREIMGLDLSRENDWFKNYFVDMMGTLKGLKLETLGLERVKRATENRAPSNPDEKSKVDSIKDFFWG